MRLQWGHDQLIVEGSRPMSLKSMHSSASMGPRSVDRGRPSSRKRFKREQLWLQWGHDQLIVEGVPLVILPLAV